MILGETFRHRSYGIALFALPFESVVYSFIGALVLNMTIAWNFHISQARRVPAAE